MLLQTINYYLLRTENNKLQEVWEGILKELEEIAESFGDMFSGLKALTYDKLAVAIGEGPTAIIFIAVAAVVFLMIFFSWSNK